MNIRGVSKLRNVPKSAKSPKLSSPQDVSGYFEKKLKLVKNHELETLKLAKIRS